jgi:hypothetical protein
LLRLSSALWLSCNLFIAKKPWWFSCCIYSMHWNCLVTLCYSLTRCAFSAHSYVYKYPLCIIALIQCIVALIQRTPTLSHMLHLSDALWLYTPTYPCCICSMHSYCAPQPIHVAPMRCTETALLRNPRLTYVASSRCTSTSLLYSRQKRMPMEVASVRCTHTDLVRDAVVALIQRTRTSCQLILQVAPARRTHMTPQYFAPSPRVVNKFL